ncbi:MAG: amidohydrolase, partial [Halobacteria archaeon]|nr:amidohydrolase [Halobacteria archaeon]
SKYLSFDPDEVQTQLLEELSGSIMYGSDYPNLPYPYEEERAGLLSRDLSQKAYRDIFYRTSLLFLEG